MATVTIKSTKSYPGNSIESNWRLPCQLVIDTDGNTYVNTPQFTSKTFEAGVTVTVTFGSTFGKSSNERYKTISPSRY